jgi:transcriptional regulator with XRE-family HTH domain
MAYRLEDQDEPTREALAVLGSTFRQIRHARGLTQRQLEARSGVSQSVISRFENGKAPWLSATLIARLLAALDLQPGLLGFGDRAVKSDVPAWVTLMQRFEAKRRRLDLQTIEERQRLHIEERGERVRREKRLELLRREQRREGVGREILDEGPAPP